MLQSTRSDTSVDPAAARSTSNIGVTSALLEVNRAALAVWAHWLVQDSYTPGTMCSMKVKHEEQRSQFVNGFKFTSSAELEQRTCEFEVVVLLRFFVLLNF